MQLLPSVLEGESGRAAHRRARFHYTPGGGTEAHASVRQNCSSIRLWSYTGASANPAFYRDMEARRAYRRAWMHARRARKEEPVAAHPQKSRSRKSQLRRGWLSRQLHGPGLQVCHLAQRRRSASRARLKSASLNNWGPRDYQMNVWRYLERGGKNARYFAFGTGAPVRMTFRFCWAAASMIDKPAT